MEVVGVVVVGVVVARLVQRLKILILITVDEEVQLQKTIEISDHTSEQEPITSSRSSSKTPNA